MPPKFKITIIAVISFITLILSVREFDLYKKTKESDDLFELIEVFKESCQQYAFDIGQYPREHFDVAYSNFLAHNLIANPANYEVDTSTMLSWNGPYIEERFLKRVYMYPGIIRIENFIETSEAFDLDSDNYPEIKGKGCYVTFSNVPLDLADSIDKKIDERLSNSNWQTTGKVKYSEKTHILSVLLVWNIIKGKVLDSNAGGGMS
ncbi:MAG: hypothetical protein JW867_08385 [Candidatus Omnitrophica bacterium]|nr:hypothetical protein [Candidatus Omnitrophota bacterium]